MNADRAEMGGKSTGVKVHVSRKQRTGILLYNMVGVNEQWKIYDEAGWNWMKA